MTSQFSWMGRGARRRRSPLPLAVLLIAAASVLAGPGAAAPSADVEITLAITGTLGMNSWYTSNVTVNWVVTGAANSSGCDAKTLTADTSGVTLTCSASNLDGTSSASKSRTFKIDKTPPAVTATPARPADKNGWYNHPLAVKFSGTDATSGIGACTSADYKGPDDPSAAVPGSCTDVAGNTGASKFALEYDATPPSLARLSVKAGDRTAKLAWTVSADTRTIEVIRRPGARGSAKTTIYRGRATGFQDRRLAIGTRYRYMVKALDQAGNAASKAAALTATGPLLSPLPGGSVSSPPLLTWTRCERSQLLQRPARPGDEDPQRVAAPAQLPPPAFMDLRRKPLPAEPRDVSLVRVARLWEPVVQQVRPAARRQLVHRA